MFVIIACSILKMEKKFEIQNDKTRGKRSEQSLELKSLSCLIKESSLDVREEFFPL
jgi:hypothetical protein